MNETTLSPKKRFTANRRFDPLFKNPGIQAYMMISLSIFTIAFFGFLAIRPTLKTIVVLNRQIEDKTQINEKLNQKINLLIKAQEEYQKLQQLLPTIYTLLPDSPDFPLLVRKLELLTQNNEATLSGIQFSPIVLYGNTPVKTRSRQPESQEQMEDTAQISPVSPATQPLPAVPLTPISFNMTYGGDYQKLISMLEQLTRFNRLITIESIRLQKDQTANITINLSTQAYYYPTE